MYAVPFRNLKKEGCQDVFHRKKGIDIQQLNLGSGIVFFFFAFDSRRLRNVRLFYCNI